VLAVEVVEGAEEEVALLLELGQGVGVEPSPGGPDRSPARARW
jgi:hypothetical protein